MGFSGENWLAEPQSLTLSAALHPVAPTLSISLSSEQAGRDVSSTATSLTRPEDAGAARSREAEASELMAYVPAPQHAQASPSVYSESSGQDSLTWKRFRLCPPWAPDLARYQLTLRVSQAPPLLASVPIRPSVLRHSWVLFLSLLPCMHAHGTQGSYPLAPAKSSPNSSPLPSGDPWGPVSYHNAFAPACSLPGVST